MAKPPVNAIDIPFARDVDGAFARLEADPEVRAVVLAGLDGCFSAGLDLKALPGYGPDEQKEILLALGRMLLRLYGFPRPVVAAVQGHAIAGGLIVALACDYRVGGDGEYRLGLTEVAVGVPFPIAPLELARAELRPDMARRLVLTARTHGPREALEWGILDELRPSREVLTRAIDVAGELGALPPRTYARSKRLLRAPALSLMEEAVDRQMDPALSDWLTPEAAPAAAKVLDRD